MKALVFTVILGLLSSASFAETTAVTETEIPTATATVNEKDIPVVLEATNKGPSGASSSTKIVLTISIAGILGAALFFYVRKNAKGSAKSEATQIKILTQQYLGPKKHLAIIRVAGESILVGITDHSINHIKTLSLLDDDIPEAVPTTFKIKNTEIAEDEDREEFSMAGIRDVVSNKLKNMRSIE